jgi:prevent-host-death family protein
MKLSEQVKPISYFKDNAAKVITDITESREPLIITQNGEATCVVQDIRSYEENSNTIALLKILAMGRKQIAEGKLRPARAVFADMDKDFLK